MSYILLDRFGHFLGKFSRVEAAMTSVPEIGMKFEPGLHLDGKTITWAGYSDGGAVRYAIMEVEDDSCLQSAS